MTAVRRGRRHNGLVLWGAIILGVMTAASAAAPLLGRYGPTEQKLVERLRPPSLGHPMGTDDLGRDVFSRVLHGGRLSLLIGIVAVAIAVLLGTAVGLAAGYFGGAVDGILMRFVDIMLCFPSFFLILMVIGFLGPNIYNVMVVIGATSWMGLARLVRGETLSLRERDFVWAAKGLGLSHTRILGVHIVPHVLSPILITATFSMGAAVLAESALSFLGLGVQPPAPSWGNILYTGKDYLHVAWWLILFPGLAIFVLVLALNLLGEGLRQMFDPRSAP